MQPEMSLAGATAGESDVLKFEQFNIARRSRQRLP